MGVRPESQYGRQSCLSHASQEIVFLEIMGQARLPAPPSWQFHKLASRGDFGSELQPVPGRFTMNSYLPECLLNLPTDV
ncbi:MAG: hypothetical protein DWH91_13885 [Planctomycetota bacterium]|nr:MAG: hypothetical protein DWH91_13885 [Planctomycetota bacterium]